jgi:hypothetical protein
LEAPVVHPDLAPLSALALADEHGAAARVKVWLGQCHRLADAEPCPPEHDDQGTQSEPVI